MPDLDAHYREIRERHGYDRVDFDLGDLPADHLRRKFAAVDDREAVAAALDRPTLVATGVGMTGPPHVGTLGAMYDAVALQDAGLDVQFVLADIEPYHGGADRERVRELAGRYRSLLLHLGFDPERGALRTQWEARDVMHTAHLLARHYDPEAGDYWPDTEPTAWEDALSEAYDRDGRGPSGPTSEAAAAHSGVLHLADFLHPLTRGYEQVVVALGIDEYALTLGTRRFLDDAPVEGRVAGLHSRLVPGLGGYPKMCKSIPGSGITLAMAPETVRERVRGADDGGGDPDTSPVFGMLCLASPYGPEELDRLERVCRAGGEAWAAARADYADHLATLAARWGEGV